MADAGVAAASANAQGASTAAIFRIPDLGISTLLILG
jgi:hypothetical protein